MGSYVGVLEDVRAINGFNPSSELVAFLEGRTGMQTTCSANTLPANRGKPVFLGFGSMVMADKEVHRLVRMVLRSAAMAGNGLRRRRTPSSIESTLSPMDSSVLHARMR